MSVTQEKMSNQISDGKKKYLSWEFEAFNKIQQGKIQKNIVMASEA